MHYRKLMFLHARLQSDSIRKIHPTIERTPQCYPLSMEEDVCVMHLLEAVRFVHSNSNAVWNQCVSIVSDSWITVITVPKGKKDYNSVSEPHQFRRILATEQFISTLSLTNAQSISILVDKWNSTESKTKPDDSVISSVLVSLGGRIPLSDTEEESRCYFEV